MDEKTRTKLSPGNNNTSIILKKLLSPFMERYRDLIIDARICGNMDELKIYIGSENYEEFNDIIDYIDMLVDMGLENKMNMNCLEDKVVIEYKNQIDRLYFVYDMMRKHYDKYVKQKKLKN